MPVAPPPAPSPAPAPAPAPAGAPAAAPAASPNLEQPTEDWMGDIGKDIESLDDDNKPVRPAPPDSRRRQEGLEDDELEEERHQPESKDQREQPAPGDKPQGAKPPDEPPKKIGELRKAYEDQKKRIAEEFQPEITKLRNRVKELEEIVAKPDGGLSKEQIEAIQKRNEELESEIRFTNFTKSKEFADKYAKPYQEAYARALSDVTHLEVELEGGQVRKANEEDLLAIANKPIGEDRKEANRLFGDAAEDVLYHARKLRELAIQQDRALKEAMETSKTRDSELKNSAQKEAAIRDQLWDAANSELSKQFPRYFAPVENDQKGNALLSRGFALADMLFKGGKITDAEKDLLPKSFKADMQANGGRLTPKAVVRLHALIRNKVANHDRLAYQAITLRKELDEAKKALAEYDNSTPPMPGGSRSRRPRSGDMIADANAEIDSLDK